MKFAVSIGLEIHVQLRTRTKIFCGCSTAFGSPPNTQVCPVCLGLPGALPVLNREAVRLTVMAGLALGCRINRRSKFDRKNYFYPDMPKNYQISQYDLPLCVGGGLEIATPNGTRFVRLRRIHLEEDVGKNLHFAQSSAVDFNRAGVPLMEIVTEPDLTSADEAHAFLQALREVLLYGGISDCNLEEGNLRCDVNISVRPEGAEELGVKTELKNLNSFRAVHRALDYEIRRQTELLSRGASVMQETRRWNDELGITESMRTKEEAHDYRYFPEPDLVPVELTEEQIVEWRALLPELPAARRARLVREYGLPEYDAGVLTADPDVADFFEAAARRTGQPKLVSNWIMTEVLRVLGERGISIRDLPLTPEALAELIETVQRGVINMPTAKSVLAEIMAQGGRPTEIIQRRGLAQINDPSALEPIVAEVLRDHPGPADDYRKGKTSALQFLIGQVMKRTRGKANPTLVAEVLRARLDGPASPA